MTRRSLVQCHDMILYQARWPRFNILKHVLGTEVNTSSAGPMYIAITRPWMDLLPDT